MHLTIRSERRDGREEGVIVTRQEQKLTGIHLMQEQRH